jgi:hypothetical protein
MARVLFRALRFLAFPSLSVPLFAFLLPLRLEAVADALLGMAHIDLLFRLL